MYIKLRHKDFISFNKEMSTKITELLDKLKANKQLLIGVFVVSLFVFVFFACMLGFIDHAKVCFTNPPTNTGTASPVPGVMSKTDSDFVIAGDFIASLGLIAGLIALILCGIVMKNLSINT
jgi:hypothetical protein